MKSFFLSGLVFFLFAGSPFPQNPQQPAVPPGMIFELLALNKDIPTVARPKYLSPCALAASPDSHYLYVAEQTAKQIGVVDLVAQSLKSNIKLPNEITGIAVAPDGSRLYATCSSDLWPSGIVCEIDVAAEKVLRRIPAGFGARSPIITHNGKTLFVCNQYENTVSLITIASGKEDAKIPSSREPYAAAITPDDSVLVVANCMPVEKSTDTMKIASKITLIDAFAGKVKDTIPLPTGSHSVLGLTIAPDGNYAYATHLIGTFAIPGTRIDGGHIQSNHCAIIDIKHSKILNVACLDFPQAGDANPWSIGCTPDGKLLCITHAGSNELSVMDKIKLDSIAEHWNYDPNLVTDTGSHPQTLSRTFTVFTEDVKERVLVQGNGPRALAIIGTKAYVTGIFGAFMEKDASTKEQIEIFNLSVGSTKVVGTIDLGTQPLTAERKGEHSFYDANICLQKWQSCHSCHPFARPDGLNWTLRSALNAPKNTKNLICSWWTPPMNWTGSRPQAGKSDGSIRMGMINQLFLQPEMEIADNMDTFFMKMKPAASPHLVKGKLSAAALKGKNIFHRDSTDCHSCHSGSLYTDLKSHQSIIPDPYDPTIKWDTPSLIECWRTGPYNHLGSMSTILKQIRNTDHSNASIKLTQEEIDQLVEFVSSL
jgi:DNA-binding beta-propeller fold protein YncE